MANLSQISQGYLTDWLKGTALPTAPVSLRLALSTANPLDTGAGLVEPGGGYTRQPISFGPITVNESPGVSMSNSGVISFPGMPAVTITHVAIFTIGGVMLWYAPVDSVKATQAGSTFDFIAGDVTVTLGGTISGYLGSAFENWMKGTAMPAAPASLLLRLSAGNPFRNASAINPPSGGAGYLDQAFSFGVKTFTSGVGTTMANISAIIFSTASALWPAITHTAVYDSTGTSMLLYGPITVPVVVPTGGGFGVAVGGLSIVSN
jgi:hypothetical protein